MPEETPAGGLGNVRDRIDTIDRELLALMSERGELGSSDRKVESKGRNSVYAPDRESEILQRICADNPGPFSDKVLLAVYRELMSGSFSLEKPLRIDFLGPLGSYSHLAATSNSDRPSIRTGRRHHGRVQRSRERTCRFRRRSDRKFTHRRHPRNTRRVYGNDGSSLRRDQLADST